MTTSREKLIEEALKALVHDPEVPTGVRPHLLGGVTLVIRERTDAEPIVRAALAVLEKAHTPTDDEREALWDAFDDIHRITEGGCDTRGNHVADMVLGLGFRRTGVPEPSAECPQPCEHLSQHDAREGRTCSEHPCTCRKPQGEPSDARVAAEPSAQDLIDYIFNPEEDDENGSIRYGLIFEMLADLRLRAAAEAGGEGR